MIRNALMLTMMTAGLAHAQERELAAKLGQLEDKSISTAGFTERMMPRLLGDDARERIRAANRRETETWRKVANREDWEQYVRPRIEALRRSLGESLPFGGKVEVHVSRTIKGDGYRIENTVFQSHHGLWVTANLYLPEKEPRSMPGILIIHSHHNPKTQGELQDMGIIWSKAGCAVLVMDQIGHGERRDHPFNDEKSYDGKFPVSRQDYHFRYNLSLQLYAIGESLIGWMANDVRRGVDLLLQKGCDKEKIILMGSVAGGGDPAGVTAALDGRIKAVVPFNFGGPQPETVFPLPEDTEHAFNYAGGGSWESTRNLRLSAREGFMPWVIVGSVAPRGLIHAHEFAWDMERDPVWKRYQKIFGFYKAEDRLTWSKGAGSVRGSGPGNTHCNNIGAVHRKCIYPALEKWFGIAPPAKENDTRHPSADLMCWTPELKKQLKPRTVWETARKIGDEQTKLAEQRFIKNPGVERKRQEWAEVLGDIEPRPVMKVLGKESEKVGDVTFERTLLQLEENVLIPVLLLSPRRDGGKKAPIVVGVAQDGKAAFLRKRADDIAELLKKGIAVCLIEVRGTGESKPGDGRGRTSGASSISASELMLGHPLLGSRLRDLRSVLAWLRKRDDVDGVRMAVWGESFSPVNAQAASLAVPYGAEQEPNLAEPLGGLLALFAKLYEADLHSAYGRGGLSEYVTLLESPFLYVPHDTVVPGAVKAGDLRFVRGYVFNYRQSDVRDAQNRFSAGPPANDSASRWLIGRLTK
jgi:hypothetical protein